MVKFRCDLCGSYFATEFLFASHKFRHTIDSDDEEETPSNSSGKSNGHSEVEIHPNNNGGKKFVSSSIPPLNTPSTSYAMKDQEPTSQERTDNTVSDLKCEVCGKNFRNESSLSSHRRINHFTPNLITSSRRRSPESHKCNECGETFRIESTLRAHMETHLNL